MVDFKKSENHPKQTVHHNSPDQLTPARLGILERDWSIALILSIFLGWCGIDQFYLGKVGKGILKLFTLGLFGILWLIDIIMIATKSVGGVAWRKPKSGGWFKNHKAFAIVGGLIILLLIILAVTTGSKTPATTNTATTANTTPASSTSNSQPATTSKPATTATRQVTGTAVTLGAGTFTGGTDVAVGSYSVTTGAGQSGNFIVTGNGENYDEILGVSDGQGVPSVEAQISKGDQIQISGLSSVTFTPVSTPYITTHTAVTLGAGTWIVGQDIGAGRYVAAPASGQSGNFIVTGSGDNYDEILGGGSDTGGVPNVTANLSNGAVIQISGMYGVTMTPTN